jgi:uncharacterized DUF497 family protein
MFEWDAVKNTQNILERGIDFAIAEAFEWPTALVIEDKRHDYGEIRLRAIGKISDKLHVLVFTPRQGKTRIISLRRANKREEHIHEKSQEG